MMYLLRCCIAALAVLVLASCGESEPTAPTPQKTTVRLYNGMAPSKSARLSIAGVPLDAAVLSGTRSLIRQIDASAELVDVVVDGGAGSQPYASIRAAFPAGVPSSVIVFPSTSAFEPTRYADSVVVVRDTGSPAPGKSRLRVINATDAGTWTLGELSVHVDQTRAFSITDLPLRKVSKWVSVDPGERQIRVVREWQIPYDAATRGVTFVQGASYTLFLTGTLSAGDAWVFTARLYSDNDQSAAVDLLIPPDVGSFQVVNAVTGIRSIDVKIDGKIIPSMSQLPFPNASGYLELDLGTHALEILTNSTPLVDNVRTVATLRSRKTMFVTGTLVPPNIVGLELSEPERAPNVSMAYIRVGNLCPDAPMIDIALKKDTTETIPEGFRSLEFREFGVIPGSQEQFLALAPGTYTIVGYRTGTKNIVLPPSDVRVDAGEVRTLWAGGLLSKISLQSVTHAK